MQEIQATIHNETQLKKWMGYTLKNVKFPLRYSVKEFKKPKTKDQLGYIWGAIQPVAMKHFHELGENYDENETIAKLYQECLEAKEKVLDNGQVFSYFKTMSMMDRSEMTDFIISVRNYLHSIGCFLPPDIEYCWLLKINELDVTRAMMTASKASYENNSFLRYQRREGACMYCGIIGDNEPHHIRTVGTAGTAQKPPDYMTISICNKCHTGDVRVQDKPAHVLEKELPLYGFDLKTFTILNYDRWVNHR
jgi:galactose-1-phosphate uridylyltransferase